MILVCFQVSPSVSKDLPTLLTFLGFAPRTSVVLESVFGGLPIPDARISCSTSSNHGAPPWLSSRHFSTVEAVTPRPSHLRTARKLIMPVRLRLKEVATRSDLADALSVPVAVIGVLSLLGSGVKTPQDGRPSAPRRPWQS